MGHGIYFPTVRNDHDDDDDDDYDDVVMVIIVHVLMFKASVYLL